MNDRYTEMLANIELMDNCRLLYFTKINIFPHLISYMYIPHTPLYYYLHSLTQFSHSSKYLTISRSRMIAASSFTQRHTPQLTGHTRSLQFEKWFKTMVGFFSRLKFPHGHMELIMLQPRVLIFSKRPSMWKQLLDQNTSQVGFYSTFHALTANQTQTF